MVKKIMANLDGVSLVLAGRKDFELSLSTNVQKFYTIPGPNNKKFWGRKSWGRKSWGRIDYIPLSTIDAVVLSIPPINEWTYEMLDVVKNYVKQKTLCNSVDFYSSEIDADRIAAGIYGAATDSKTKEK